MRKFLSFVLIFALFLMMSTTAFAVAPDTPDVWTNGEQKETVWVNVLDKQIIGGSDAVSATRLPNILVVNYTATAKTIDITYTNYGLDTIDTVSSTVTINGVTKSVPVFAAPVGTTKKTVYFDLKKCHESISVVTKASDGGDSLGTTNTPGHRDLPQMYVNVWHPGTFASSEISLEYHFAKHAAELKISNLQSYATSAISFRLNLKGATTSPVFGFTEQVTRYKKSGKYVDICGPKNTGLIVSYGKQ